MLRDIYPPLVEQGHRSGADHHHAIVPLAEVSKPAFFARRQPYPAALLDQSMVEDAILHGWLTLTHLPEGVIIKSGKSSEGRFEILGDVGKWAEGSSQSEASLLLDWVLVLLGTLLQCAIDVGRKIQHKRWLRHIFVAPVLAPFYHISVLESIARHARWPTAIA